MDLCISRGVSASVIVAENIERADLGNPDHVKSIVDGIREGLEMIASHDKWVKENCDCYCRDRGFSTSIHSSSCTVMNTKSPVEEEHG